MPNLHWWPLIASMLHIVEEFVVPGGFAAWDRKFRPAYAASITPRLHVIMNALLLLAGVAVGRAGAAPQGVAAWLTLAALLAGNAVFHLVGAIGIGLEEVPCRHVQGGDADVLGLVNNTHPPAAQFLDDAVMRERLADKR
jgi:hypothetical protein